MQGLERPSTVPRLRGRGFAPPPLRDENDNVNFVAMTLGDLQNLAMLAVARAGNDAVAGRVREVLAEIAGREVSVSTVFVTLTRLEDQGLVSSRTGEAPARGGRRTRVFALTDRGWDALRETRQASERLWEGLPSP
jgi:DNA-binding MarR family transcriptional regulator